MDIKSIINKRTSLHNHTVFSDGENTPEEMIEKAIELGFECFGISDHSHTYFDTGYCLDEGETISYFEKINSLKEVYKDRITLYTGIEQDYYSEKPASGTDYIIGSVHYVKVKENGEDVYITVDERPDKAAKTLTDAADRYFGKDIYALVAEYYRTVGDVVNKTGADIIGHFDVIAKCNHKHPIFNEKDERYIAAWKEAADRLLEHNKLFEINLSSVLRGIRTEPYPSTDIQNYIRANGGSFIYTGDCHSTSALDAFASYIQEIGS